MKLVLEGETRLRLEMTGHAFEIASEGGALSPYHLLAASLASCTALAVASWAAEAGVTTERLALTVAWTLASDAPKRVERVERIEQTLHWPDLPESRVGAVGRLAELCPIDATLRAGTDVATRVQRG